MSQGYALRSDSAIELLEEIDLAGLTNADIDTADYFDGQFRMLKLVFTGVRPVSDSNVLRMRLDVGAGYATANYAYHASNLRDAATYDGVGSTNAGGFNILTGMGASTGEVGSGEINIFDPNDASYYKQITWLVNMWNAEARTEGGSGQGVYTGSTGAIDGIRLQMTTGNFSVGKVAVYGYR